MNYTLIKIYIKSYFHIIIFLVYFLIGCFIIKDYGFSFDEQLERSKGKIYLKQVCTLLNVNNTSFGLRFKNEQNLNTFHDRYQGPVFNIFLVLVEEILNITDTQSIFFTRHFFTFIICFLGSLYFYLLIKARFNNKLLSITGWLIFVLSPRMFAESFYNSKDNVLMSLTIIAIYYLYLLFKKPSYINCILFSLFSALCIDIRIIGSIIPVIGISLLIAYYTLNYKNIFIVKNFIYLFLIIISLLSFTIIYWPLLWEKPFLHLYESYKIMSQIFWDGNVLYLGKVYHQPMQSLPWHYLPIWIIITTPILYIILAIIGLFYFLWNNIYKNIKSLIHHYEFYFDLSIIMIAIAPLFLVICLHSIVYDGWRHVYFIYPSIIYFSIYGCYYIITKFEKYFLYFYSIVYLHFAFILYQMIALHPLQNIYFNELVQHDIKKRFVVDYWGLGYRQAIEYILKIDKSESIVIAINGNPDVKLILDTKTKDRVQIHYWGKEDSDYIITNYKDQPYDLSYPNNIWNIEYKGEKMISIFKLN